MISTFSLYVYLNLNILLVRLKIIIIFFFSVTVIISREIVSRSGKDLCCLAKVILRQYKVRITRAMLRDHMRYFIMR